MQTLKDVSRQVERALNLDGWQLFSRRANEAESTAGRIKERRQSKFNFATSRESMLLPEHGHGLGWSKKQAEREDLAGQGEGWRSNA